MITKGIIKSINYTSNTCMVRLPVFETAGTKEEIVLSAVFAIQPGSYNGYLQDDVVWVGFDCDNFSNPVVIGKLYLGTIKEKENEANVAGKFSDIEITNSLTIPVNTKIDTTKVGITNTEVELTNYNSLLDIINAVRTNSQAINQLKIGAASSSTNGMVAYTLSKNSWIADGTIDPYSYKQAIQIQTTIKEDSIVSLINNDAVLFSTYGLAIGELTGQIATIYSLKQPAEDINIIIRID